MQLLWREGSLEYDLIVHPDASPEQMISLKFDGAASKFIAPNGTWCGARTGDFAQQRPTVYQTISAPA